MTTEWIQQNEAADLIGVSHQAINSYVRDGVLSYKKIGKNKGRRLVNKQEVLELVKVHTLRRTIVEERQELDNELKELRNEGIIARFLHIFGSHLTTEIIMDCFDARSDEHKRHINALVRYLQHGHISWIANDLNVSYERARQIITKGCRVLANKVVKRTDLEKLEEKYKQDTQKLIMENLALRAALKQAQEDPTVTCSTIEMTPIPSRVAKLSKPIYEVFDSVRVLTCLKSADISTLGELVVYKKKDLLLFRNLGKKSLREIEATLNKIGLDFNIDINQYLYNITYNPLK